MYVGDFRLGDTLDCKFTTVNTSGVPTTLAGTPVISAYPGNSLTELTAGITLTVDFDARTGLHNVRIVASGANGYATATNYALVITTGTVGGSSVVGYVVGHFSIEARSAVMPTTAARTLDVSAAGEAGVDWANVGSPTTVVGLSGTTIKTATDVETDTAVIGAAGAGLTAVPWNVTWDAEVQSEVQDAIEVNHLDHLLAVDYDPAAKPGVATALLNEIIGSDAGVSQFTANALELGPGGGSAPSAATIADAVWDEARADHVTTGTTGERMQTGFKIQHNSP